MTARGLGATLAGLASGAAACAGGGGAVVGQQTETAASEAAGATLTVAVVGPMTGDYGFYGEQFQQGVELAAMQLAEQGGIAGGPHEGAILEVVGFDDQLDPAQAVTIAQQIVDRGDVWAVIGSASSDTSLAAAPIHDEAGATFISWGSAPVIVEGHDDVFISAPTHPAYSYAAADTMALAGYQRAAVLQIAGAFGDSINGHFQDAFGARGGEVASDEEFAFGDRDFRPLLLAARETQADVLAPIGFAAETALIVAQARELGWDVPIVDVGGGGYGPSFLEVAGEAAEGFVGNAAYDPERATDAAEALREGFAEAFDLDAVPPSAPNQYEAARAVIAALETAEEPADVAASLRDVEIADTGVGELDFDESGLPVNRPMWIYEVRDGAFAFTDRYVVDGSDVVARPLER